ncbi:unnamed protein product [Protopolystoma xenopodis]|uniref:Uncharacterized protein n=1 Tax=Protopolystoma xenopodis TaxID=117903 RepID=A0A3S5AMQ2_9PLAT|nr:unnamed protein product [Protopolystoma xenopodis]
MPRRQESSQRPLLDPSESSTHRPVYEPESALVYQPAANSIAESYSVHPPLRSLSQTSSSHPALISGIPKLAIGSTGSAAPSTGTTNLAGLRTLCQTGDSTFSLSGRREASLLSTCCFGVSLVFHYLFPYNR